MVFLKAVQQDVKLNILRHQSAYHWHLFHIITGTQPQNKIWTGKGFRKTFLVAFQIYRG